MNIIINKVKMVAFAMTLLAETLPDFVFFGVLKELKTQKVTFIIH